MNKVVKSYVWCKVPRTGLGNQLFVIMKASLYAKMHHLPIVYTGYNQIRIGPYIRNEKTKRRYSHFFVFQKGILGELIDRLKLVALRLPIVPGSDELQSIFSGVIFKFSNIPHWSNYFIGLKNYRLQTVNIFNSLLTDEIKLAVNSQVKPIIGIHVRMGDFRPLSANEDFEHAVGAVRTPLSYFRDIIVKIRLLHGSALPVTIFSDGYDHELKELLELQNVSRSQPNKDIVDLILLSKSEIIVSSAASTFSYWAGFLSNAPLILHPFHIHEPIREPMDGLLEGVFDEHNTEIQSKIKAIKINE